MPPNIFFSTGNRDAIDQVKYIRLAKITAVNTADMVVDLEFLEESTFKTRVPVPMPMCYPGGGILAVPSVGALVIVGIRSMQIPIVLGYYPMNAMSPDSYFAITRQVFGIPEILSPGDIFMRVASDSAKCATCNVISTVAAWAANVNPTTLIEDCPNCGAPAQVNDDMGRIVTLNKQLLGSTLHMRQDGKIMIQGSNISSRDQGDTERLLKIVIDGITGEITTNDAGDITTISGGTSSLVCNNLTQSVSGDITESSDTRTLNVNQTFVEAALNKTTTVTNTTILQTETLSIQTGGISTISADTQVTLITNGDTYSSGSLSGTVAGGRIFEIGGDDQEDIGFSKSITTGEALNIAAGGATSAQATALGGSMNIATTGSLLASVGADCKATIVGDKSDTVGGATSLISTGAVTITSASSMSLTGATIKLNSGTQAVARVGDSTVSTIVSDPAFWPFIISLTTFLTTFSGDTLPFASSKTAAAATAALMPSSLRSLITTGNTTVTA